MASWSARAGLPTGEIVPIEQIWRLAQAWYHDRLDPAFRGRSVEQAQAILANVGLTSPFWRAADPGG